LLDTLVCVRTASCKLSTVRSLQDQTACPLRRLASGPAKCTAGPVLLAYQPRYGARTATVHGPQAGL